MAQSRMTERMFGLAFAVIFAAIAFIGWLVGGRIMQWAIAVSTGLLLLVLVAPGVLMPLNRIWSGLANRIGFVTNHLLLGTFFFLVLVPFGMAARLFGWSSFRRGIDRSADSYWTPVERQATAETYPDMF